MSKPIRRHNREYSGGFPIATGDRYYAQDIFRDQAYGEALTGIAYNDLTQQTAPYVLSGLVAKQGAGHTMDISAGKAVVPFTVPIPDTVAPWTVPPSTTTANIDMVLDYAGGTSLSLAGTVTDGATPNYVKLAYTETNGNTRNRVKKAGSYAYEVYDTVTVTINDTAPSATEINILTFTTDGATVTVTDNGDTRIGSPFHMQDAVVYDQTTFNDCIVRVAANQYKIRDDIKSLYAANLSGGYLMTGGTSPLSGGDTWGYIETNNCKQIIFEKGAAIHMGNERGYLEVNTDDCYLKNISIIGTGTVASAITKSFYINADYCTLIDCKTSTRLSNVEMHCFEINAAKNEETSIFTNCLVLDIESSNKIYGFFKCYNMTNCIVDNIESTGSQAYAVVYCKNLKGCITKNVTVSGGATVSIGFNGCDRLTNCKANNINNSVESSFGFNNCDNITACIAETIDHTGSVAGKNAYGFNTCTQLSSCKAEDVDTNGAGGEAHGFKSCEDISTCYATTCDNGFDTCNQIASSYSETCVIGFYNCDYLSACKALTCTGNGFEECNFNSACHALSNGGDGFHDCNICVGAGSYYNTSDGFQDCNACGNCRSNGNGAAAYNNSFADYAGTVAPGDNAAGGWNS